jgi:hypothetical protein
MEHTPASAGPTRWWHSRRNRKRALLPVYAGLIATLFWRMVNGDDAGLLPVWLAAMALIVGEWLWFRLGDPRYPHDDSLPVSTRGFLPPEGQAWWQSRYRRQEVLHSIFLLGGVTLGAPCYGLADCWRFT